ncbi:MAG: tRNA (adenosine(37)-N6)-threonylcarbamoyltransferase complex ATPase subunit type 1 TsaE [Verrucomicrobia bacterium]|nr:tRNA (adenosine(37)-N6)-threonylcarbamoyltransferase complex ATPase subunit type 1 TsaE [Verrucomicrobiota bacterium]
MQSDLFNHIHTTQSDAETHRLGASFGRELPPNAIVAFFGDLGAGKTTFIRGLVEGIGSIDTRNVCSPTFNFLNIYQGVIAVYHFDLYRLPRAEEFFAAGFDEYFAAGGVCCIEWAEKLETSLPAEAIAVTLSYNGAESRQINIARVQK